jgi:hypothetical protein
LSKLKQFYYSLDETGLEFRHFINEFTKKITIKESLIEIINRLHADKEQYLKFVQLNDDFWLTESKVSIEDRNVIENYKANRPSENLISIDGLTDETLNDNPIVIFELISNLIGVAFGRWDIRSILNPELIPEFGDFFEPLPFMPVVSLKEIPKNYPIQIPTNGILVGNHSDSHSMLKAINNVIYKIWPASSDNITNELIEIGKIDSLEQFISNSNGFFDFHYKRYTKSRREAPIYWPISTSSGSYTVWLYYPKLTYQTLVSVINNYLQPKIDDVKNQIKPLEINSNLDNKGLKELAVLKDFEHELEEMKKELLRITALPYKPNHDDGVLITAAPLFNLFRHAKWRKSTEDCWKALEKGEYDWAHLAYSIWPDRIIKKCKKDLSMAIAHGLENICEIKPKEKKAKATKSPKKGSVISQLNFEE